MTRITERLDIVNRILWCHDLIPADEIESAAAGLPQKILRSLASLHPDNRTRRTLLRMTQIEIGDDSVINVNFSITDNYKPLLKIGNRVAIASNVTIICASDPNFSTLQTNPYVARKLIVEKEVVIEDDVWIGAGVIILPGVTIGRGAIVGAGAVVDRCVEKQTVVVGIPIREIRSLKDSSASISFPSGDVG
jgi:acetyltransferase-like isoleucine patch superfamily enzyme